MCAAPRAGGAVNTLSSDMAVALIEEWFRQRGYEFVKGVNVRGSSGASHILDYMVFSERGPIGVLIVKGEVKGDDVISASRLVHDLGLAGVVIYGVEGYSEEAATLSARMGVEVLSPRDVELALEFARSGLDVVILELDDIEFRRLPSQCLGMLDRIIKRRKLEDAGCVVLPFYMFRARVMGGGRGKSVLVVTSAVSGLPLALRRGELVEVLGGPSRLDEDLQGIYASLAGRRVRMNDFVRVWGREKWVRFKRSLEATGLSRPVEGNEIEVIDERPDNEELEAASDFFIARGSRRLPSNCRVLTPRVSPGRAISIMYKLLGLRPLTVVAVLAPFKVYKVGGSECLVTGWGEKVIPYRPSTF